MYCTECSITFPPGVDAVTETYSYQCDTPSESPLKDESNELLKVKFRLKMAGKIGDSEQQRQIERIMRVAFRIARDAGATFINLKIENRKLKIENLLCSYPSRLKAVREACGQHTNY